MTKVSGSNGRRLCQALQASTHSSGYDLKRSQSVKRVYKVQIRFTRKAPIRCRVSRHFRGVRVSTDGKGVCSHVGSRLLADVAAAAGVVEAFDDVVGTRRQRRSSHAPRRVLTHLHEDCRRVALGPPARRSVHPPCPDPTASHHLTVRAPLATHDTRTPENRTPGRHPRLPGNKDQQHSIADQPTMIISGLPKDGG